MVNGLTQLEAGGLMSYGTNLPALWRRSAELVDKVSYRALKPAPAAIPTATAEKQHDDNDDQKSCGVHSVLRKSPNQGHSKVPQGA
jgi:hypothetical protein